MAQFIIKGALYFDGDVVLRPHYTGDFFVVDCTEYKKEEQIKDEYSESNAARFMSNEPIMVDGVAYYECEYSPFHTDSMELLSDLSGLTFNEYRKVFNQ